MLAVKGNFAKETSCKNGVRKNHINTWYRLMYN